MDFTGISSVPTKPRFLRECVLIPFHEGLIIEGMRHLLVFRGPAAVDILPVMIPLMDGQRTVEEIHSSLERFPLDCLVQAMSLLTAHGLIEQGPLRDELPSASLNTTTYLRRCGTSTRNICVSSEIHRNLSGSKVIVITSEQRCREGRLLRSVLTRNGVSDVEVVGLADFENLAKSRVFSNVLFVSLSVGANDTDWLETIDSACRRKNMRWLRTLINAHNDYADLGPLFAYGNTACYRCFSAVQKWSVTPSGDHQSDVPDWLLATWIGAIATEITYICSQAKVQHIVGSGFRRYALRDWKHKDLVAPRLPGCVSCGIQSSGSFDDLQGDPLVDVSFIYDEYMSLRADTIESAAWGADPMGIGFLPAQMKSLPNAKRYSFRPVTLKSDNESDRQFQTSPSDKYPLAVDDVCTILAVTAGIDDLSGTSICPKRWCATAGNLGSVELYVALNRVQGLIPGLYFYQAKDHSLAQVRRRTNDLPISKFLKLFTGEPNGDHFSPDMLVILTGAYYRLKRKYGEFAYRLINLDAGVAMSQLRLLASALNLRSADVVIRDYDEIQSFLYLDKDDTRITGAIALSRLANGEIRRAPGVSSENPARTVLPRSMKNATAFCDFDVSEITRMMMGDISQDEIGSDLQSLAVGQTFRSVHRDCTTTLPPSEAELASLNTVLQLRKSVRSFTSRPVSLQSVSNILWYAEREFERIATFRIRNSDQGDPQILIFASNVSGLKPGLFMYETRGHKLVVAKKLFDQVELSEIYIQPEFALAPLHIFLVSNPAASCARSGTNGYRASLMTLGEKIHLLSMGALNEKLAGTIVAGLKESGFRRLFGLSGYTEACFVGFVAGYET
jgi:SagB-type dehydrogenase family enzyme